MIVFQVSLNFDPVIRNAENTISHMDMLKNRQDCEHPKNAQFDIHAITSNFWNKFQ